MTRDLYSLYTNTYNFRTEVRTDFKYVPNESLKIALRGYQQNTKSIEFQLPT